MGGCREKRGTADSCRSYWGGENSFHSYFNLQSYYSISKELLSSGGEAIEQTTASSLLATHFFLGVVKEETKISTFVFTG